MTKKLSTPFAVNSTLRNDVPVKATTEQTAKGIIGYADGWTSINKLPIDNGGQAPWMEDINGVLHDITGNISDINKGLPQYFDTDFATSIGGYPIGARLCLDDNSEYVVSTIASNSNNPNSNMTGWKKTNFSEYDFKTEQPIQYYYDLLGNWDDAIFQAQMNVYLLGYSPRLIFPYGEIRITKPIYVGHAWGDVFHKARPDLNFYDATTNTYKKRIDFKLIGQGTSGAPATHITFYAKNRTDTTYKWYGIIHGGPMPDEYNASVQRWVNWWTAFEIHNMRITGFCDDGNDKPIIHGIVAMRGNGIRCSNFEVETVYGGSLICDGIYDSWFEKFVLFQGGRSSFPDWTVLNENDAKWYDTKYTTYASLHITNSQGFGEWDNSNFIRFHDFHIEDSKYSQSDIIVSGNSSPIWFSNAHFENDASEYYSNHTNRSYFCLGGIGYTKFGEDSQDGYDYTQHDYSLNKGGNGGGYAIWDGGAVYSPTYTTGYAIQVGNYSKFNIDNSNIPNSIGSLLLQTTNASGEVSATNTEFNNININGGNASAKCMTLYNCKANNLNTSYTRGFNIDSTLFTGSLSIQNAQTSWSSKVNLNNVTCDYANGILDYGDVDLTTTSTTNATQLYVARGKTNIVDNYVLTTLGGV